MKINELREILEKHSEIELKTIIVDMYKSMPKELKEEKNIDLVIKNPSAKKGGTKRARAIPDIDMIETDTEIFISNAYNQYYLIPNSIVHKKERPKWRFIVKRLYKDISLAASEKENLPLASELLEKIYILLCYSCEYVLFSGYDSFQSVGIEQKDFFQQLLSLKYQHERKNEFVHNALLLLINNSLNRYTLYSTLMEVILEYLKTADLKEMAITECDNLLKEITNSHPPAKDDWKSNYKRERNINNLTEMTFLCYIQLCEFDKAVSFFKSNYREEKKEVALYILLKLLFRVNRQDYFIQEYEEAIQNGIHPRDSLQKMYSYIQDNNKFPEYFH